MKTFKAVKGWLALILFPLLASGSINNAWGREEDRDSENCIELSTEYTAEEAFRMGIAYSTGAGGVEDSAQAVQWMRVAALQGHRYAQFNLGEAYISGYGVTQNYSDGIEWLTRAASGGLADAQVSLGLKYDEGVGVVQDSEIAVMWFRAAAMQGNSDGQNNLAIAYATGEGLAQDYVQAYMWFELAWIGGHLLGQSYRDKVTHEMSVEQLREAQARVKSWRRGADSGVDGASVK